MSTFEPVGPTVLAHGSRSNGDTQPVESGIKVCVPTIQRPSRKFTAFFLEGIHIRKSTITAVVSLLGPGRGSVKTISGVMTFVVSRSCFFVKAVICFFSNFPIAS